ncbi:hypothetical protein N7447_010594 [Penicillium robsamsonii]|uniref:uncharacterized protein n=1 Tax=Penicillium robsamsonii TaxID=1792511 RepID=UPI002547EFA6|nr:uncharacterized protein N7447_010594 [Penicillium robsamsonii]KAJ5811078.1 hypothetical protein N7447_010594 [Penicillium robsamsonii]
MLGRQEEAYSIIKILLAAGCDPNVWCRSRKAPLQHVAQAPAAMEIVRLFPFSLALESSNEPFINYAFEQGIAFDTDVILNVVHEIAGQEKRMASRVSVTYPALIQEIDINGNWDLNGCPLSLILALERDNVIKYLINKGFDVVPASHHGND